jgi:hypothetical protein
MLKSSRAWTSLAALALFAAPVSLAQQPLDQATPKLFQKIELTREFHAEGATYGDFNKDGKVDVAYGAWWWEGPNFTKKHQFAAEEFMTKKYDGAAGYSKNFFGFTHDFNHDGWPDILIVGFPGEETVWYENPQGKDEPWKRHVALKVTDNESPVFGDLLGNGHPVLVCMSGGYMGYAQPDEKNPDAMWKWHATSKKIPRYQRFTHGLGFGDVNGDGKPDLLDKEGWYEQPASLEGDPVWKKHPYQFSAKGGSQMYVYDVNGDGKNDVIASIEAHGYGLAWYEQKRDEKGEITFEKHLIMGDKPEENAYGVRFSELHAVAMADMDGDGLMGIVTGKRFWAHGPHGDAAAEPNAPAVLYFFKLVRSKNADGSTKVDWIPYLIDNDSGVGTQVTVGNISGGPLPDVLVGNKKGGFVFINQIDKLGKDALEKAAPKPVTGTAAAAK